MERSLLIACGGTQTATSGLLSSMLWRDAYAMSTVTSTHFTFGYFSEAFLSPLRRYTRLWNREEADLADGPLELEGERKSAHANLLLKRYVLYQEIVSLGGVAHMNFTESINKLLNPISLAENGLAPNEFSFENYASLSLAAHLFVIVLDAVIKISQVLAEQSNEGKKGAHAQLSAVALLALMFLLAVLRFASKPFGSRAKGRLVVSLGASADPNEVGQTEAQARRARALLAYHPTRNPFAVGLNSRTLHPAVVQSGI